LTFVKEIPDEIPAAAGQSISLRQALLNNSERCSSVRTTLHDTSNFLDTFERFGPRSDAKKVNVTDHTHTQSLKNKNMHRAFVALGGNMGDRFAMIEQACNEMEKADITVVRTSGLWETKAMYVEDQDKFLNGVCEVRTAIDCA
jgi:hypothetical protein